VSKLLIIFVKQPVPQVKRLRDSSNLWDFYRMFFSSFKNLITPAGTTSA